MGGRGFWLPRADKLADLISQRCNVNRASGERQLGFPKQLFLQVVNDKKAFAKSGHEGCMRLLRGWHFGIEKVF